MFSQINVLIFSWIGTRWRMPSTSKFRSLRLQREYGRPTTSTWTTETATTARRWWRGKLGPCKYNHYIELLFRISKPIIFFLSILVSHSNVRSTGLCGQCQCFTEPIFIDSGWTPSICWCWTSTSQWTSTPRPRTTIKPVEPSKSSQHFQNN